MISEKTRILGSLVATYFSIVGYDVIVETDMFFDFVYETLVKERNVKMIVQNVLIDRLAVRSDFLVSCVDFPDVGKCERQRDRLYEKIWGEVEEEAKLFVKEHFSVLPYIIWSRFEHVDEIVDSAITFYVTKGRRDASTAILDALNGMGYEVPENVSGIDCLYDIIFRWVGDIAALRALMYVVLLSNYTMAFVLLYLEERKDGR